jgi:lipoprotein-releasing system ATP-binding protein
MNSSVVKRECDLNSQKFLISFKDLYKSYFTNKIKINILENAEINIKQGETLAIVGSSGIGKSTLLNILGTLDKPDKGSFLFNNMEIFKFCDKDLAKFRNKSIGFVFQFHHLLNEFSSIENVMIPVLISGLDKQNAKKKAEIILKRVGLGKRLDHKVNQLSGGEQQRVAIARALVIRPKLLLADEPTGNLDKTNSKHVHNLLKELNQEFNMTMVIVTHNMDLANYMSRIVTIADGKLLNYN